MAAKKVSLFLAVFLLSSIFIVKNDRCLAENKSMAELQDAVEKLQKRLAAMENKLVAQDQCIKEQQAQIEEQNRKIAEYESKIGHMDIHDLRKSEGFYKKAKEEISSGVKIEKVAHGAKRQVHYEPGVGIHAEEAGIIIGADATFILQGTPNANNAVDAEDSRFDGSWSSDIEIEKTFGDWGLAFIHLEAGQGETVEPELALFSNVNRDAMASTARVEVTEAWYVHSLFDKQADLTAGKLDFTIYFDQNDYANDETSQFLCHMFRNSPNIEFPADNTLGFQVHLAPKFLKFFEFDIGYFDANADWENIFDNGFFMFQTSLKPAEIFDDVDPEKWGGNYRLYTWLNGLYHEKLVNEGDITEDTKEINYGFGLSLDQMITDVYGVFVRFGWQRPDIALASGEPTLEWSWSAGAQMKGKYWKREDDVLAIAIGQAFPSKEWQKSASNHYGAGEGHLEVYYRCQLNKCLAVSPDLQLIWNPNGVSKSSEGDNNPIFVYGLRGQIDF